MESLASDHAQVVERARRGELLVGVDRGDARKLYTDVPISVIKEHTGEAPYAEKAIILGAFVGAPVCLVAALVLAGVLLRWWAILAIPVAVLGYIAYWGTSSRGDSRNGLMGYNVFAMAVLMVLDPLHNRAASSLVLVYVLALWLARFVYTASTSFMRGFVLRNPRAFAWLQDSLVIREKV